MYVPVGQLPDAVTTFFVRQMPLTWIVRTAVDPLSIGASVERALRTASNGLPVTRIRSMNDVAADSIARTRFATLLMTMFGCTASLLAATGIYVMMASSVTQRTHEIGIRMALGAQTSAVRIKILVQGMTLALLGIALGTAAAFAVTRLLASFLFGISPRDATVFVWVAALLTSIAFAAVWFPARRASRVDPMSALRVE